MADGRFVSRSISTNEQLARVSFLADYLFQRCIPHLDREGRMTGNPALIKANVVPLRPEYTIDNIPDLLVELGTARDHDGVPLLIWYMVNGVRALEFPGFAGQQQGMRKEREAESRFPERTASATILTPSTTTPASLREQVPTNSGNLGGDNAGSSPAEVKRSEEKGREEKKPASDDAGESGEADAEDEATARPKRGKASHPTWLTPFADLWRERYGGTMSMGPAAKSFKSLVDEWGAGEVLRRWEHYVTATDGAFASPARFAATFGEWNAPRSAGKSSPSVMDHAHIRAAELWPIYVAEGFISAVPDRTRVAAVAANMVERLMSRSVEEFIAELKIARPWLQHGKDNDAYSIQQIAQRLRDAAEKARAVA